MEFTSIPIIVVLCYIIGEIYKVIFRKKKEAKKLIPIVMAIVGGILGILIYLTNPEIIFKAENIWIFGAERISLRRYPSSNTSLRLECLTYL